MCDRSVFKLGNVNQIRRCSRPGCGQPALATLTYAYAESTAVVGPLTSQPDPHSWDLCQKHSEKITAPVGWEIVRVGDIDIDDEEDLVALAAAVRENGRVTSGLVEDPDASPVAHTSAFADAADPERSNHPVHRVPRVVEQKQQRRAHLQVVPETDSGEDSTSEATAPSVNVNGSRHALSQRAGAGKQNLIHDASAAEVTEIAESTDNSGAGQKVDAADEGADFVDGQGAVEQSTSENDGDPVDSMLAELRDSSTTDFAALWPDDSSEEPRA